MYILLCIILLFYLLYFKKCNRMWECSYTTTSPQLFTHHLHNMLVFRGEGVVVVLLTFTFHYPLLLCCDAHAINFQSELNQHSIFQHTAQLNIQTGRMIHSQLKLANVWLVIDKRWYVVCTLCKCKKIAYLYCHVTLSLIIYLFIYAIGKYK